MADFQRCVNTFLLPCFVMGGLFVHITCNISISVNDARHSIIYQHRLLGYMFVDVFLQVFIYSNNSNTAACYVGPRVGAMVTAASSSFSLSGLRFVLEGKLQRQSTARATLYQDTYV
jgi:hypothetical protein